MRILTNEQEFGKPFVINTINNVKVKEDVLKKLIQRRENVVEYFEYLILKMV